MFVYVFACVCALVWVCTPWRRNWQDVCTCLEEILSLAAIETESKDTQMENIPLLSADGNNHEKVLKLTKVKDRFSSNARIGYRDICLNIEVQHVFVCVGGGGYGGEGGWMGGWCVSVCLSIVCHICNRQTDRHHTLIKSYVCVCVSCCTCVCLPMHRNFHTLINKATVYLVCHTLKI